MNKMLNQPCAVSEISNMKYKIFNTKGKLSFERALQRRTKVKFKL